MTSEQKALIEKLRIRGIKYADIAKAVELSESTIKSYCYRHEIKAVKTVNAENADLQHSRCEECGKVLSVSRFKPRRFCSDSCRQKYWNTHISQLNHAKAADGKAKVTEFTCPTCGEKFTAYLKRNRKYCSHACYIIARYGNSENANANADTHVYVNADKNTDIKDGDKNDI